VAAHDPVALAEIDLYGDLIIAAAATPFDRLSADRIDQVLQVRQERSDAGDPGADTGAGPRTDPLIPVQRDGSGC
jgi:hypothetical protein